MNNKKGYTMPELLILLTVVGVISLVFILKTSYAFKNNDSELLNAYYKTIEKQSILYGEKNIDKFNENNELIITCKMLAEENYLPVEEDGTILSDIKDFTNTKIIIKKNDDKITAQVEK